MSGRTRQETAEAQAAASHTMACTQAPETQPHLDNFSLNCLPLEIREMIWEFSFAISACPRPTERQQETQPNNPVWGEQVTTKFQTIGYGRVTLPSPEDTQTPYHIVDWLAEGPSGGLVRRPFVFTRRLPPSATACREAYSTFVRYYRQHSKSSSELLRLNQTCEQARPAVIIHEIVKTGPAKGLSLLPIVPPKEMNIPLVLDLTAALFYECDRFVIENAHVHRDRVMRDDDPAHPLGDPRVLDLILSSEDVYDRIKIRMSPTRSGLVRFMIPTPPSDTHRPASISDPDSDLEAEAESTIPPLTDTARVWLEKCQIDRTTVLISLNDASMWKELAEIAAYFNLSWPFVEKLAESGSHRQELVKQALSPLYKTWERENKLRAKRGEEPHKEIPRLDVVVAVQVAMPIATHQHGNSAGRPPLLPGSEFFLFSHAYRSSFDSFETLLDYSYSSNRVYFQYHEDDEPAQKKESGTAATERKVYAEIHFGSHAYWETVAFRPPELDQSGKATVVVKRDGGEEEEEMTFRFFGDKHLELDITKQSIISECDYSAKAMKANVHFLPKVFKFVGGTDVYKTKEAPKKVIPRPPRSPSPRETWFELNHPMGAYYDSRYSEYF